MSDFRGQRAILKCEDGAEFNCEYIINKSHEEDGVIVIDDITLTNVNIIER